MTTRYTLHANKGFTLIELLVVVGILALLTSLLVLYSRDSEKQLALSREKAKLANAILRAKSLSVQTYRSGEAVCGYGIHLAPNGYRIFKDPKVSGSCLLSNKTWDDSSEDVQVVDLADNISLSANPSATDVFFTPPDPKVLLSPGNLNETTITLSTTIGGQVSTVNININNAGQVSTN